ncbi:hypothetical protein ACFWY5_52535 [Nonomuraea sp. NPDC059007]|uniref:hypothetical protein n=1 Tax=Nonomuraea sp. NPDC059007 TaxID=3346692 RepID=UPI00369EF2E7
MKRARPVILRLMMLVVLALGILAMHSLGHPRGHDMAPATSHASAQTAPADPDPDDGWVCLAFLGTAASLILTLFALGTTPGPLVPRDTRTPIRQSRPRGPPLVSPRRTAVLLI